MIKVTNVKIAVLLIMSLASVAQAQNKMLKFTNGQETEIQGNATINISTGDITVQPVSDKLIVDKSQALVGLYPDTYAVSSFPEGITLNWVVAYASNCTASVSAGNANGWSGTNVTNGANDKTVTINSANTTLELSCESEDGSGSVAAEPVTIVQASTGGGTTSDPIINTFKLTSYPGTNPTIPNDGNYNIQWSVSNLTGSCTASTTSLNHGGWTGSVGSNGNRNIDITDEPTLRLICSNGGNSIQKSIVITNSGTGGGGTNPPANCAQVDVRTPPGLVATNFKYDDPYLGGLPQPPAVPNANGFGHAFGHPDNSTVNMINYINPEQRYIVVSNLQVPSSDIDLKYVFSGSPGYGEHGNSTMSFSECPGNFNPSTARCVLPLTSSSNILLSNRTEVANSGWGSQPSFCHLEKGKTYYVNIVFSNPYDATNFNGVTEGEECLSAVGNKCAVFWGEKAWNPGL